MSWKKILTFDCFDKANTKINELEAYNHKPNLVISGLAITSYVNAASQQSGEHGEPSSSSISAENAVLELVYTRLGVKISSSDISIAHRLKQRQPSNRPPSIIVRFTSMKVRNHIYRACRSLKNSHPPVYINENLTKMTANLYQQARELVKYKVLHAAWTSGGALFICKSEEASCKLQKISTESALRDA